MNTKLNTLFVILMASLLAGCTSEGTNAAVKEETTTVTSAEETTTSAEETTAIAEETTIPEETTTEEETTAEETAPEEAAEAETEAVNAEVEFDTALTDEDLSALKLYLDIINVNFTHNEDCLLDVYFYDYGGDGTLDMTVRPVTVGLRRGIGGMLYCDDGDENCREYFYRYDDAVERWGYYESGENSNIHYSFAGFNGDDSWYKLINLGNSYKTSDYIMVTSVIGPVEGITFISITDSTVHSLDDTGGTLKNKNGYCEITVDDSGAVVESREEHVYSYIRNNFDAKYDIDLSSCDYIEDRNEYVISVEDASSILEYISGFDKFDNILHCRLDAQEFKDMPFETFIEYLKDPNV